MVSDGMEVLIDILILFLSFLILLYHIILFYFISFYLFFLLMKINHPSILYIIFEYN